MTSKLKIGDRIKFLAPTRNNSRVAWRKINGFFDERPTVRFEGCGDFIVRRHEIIEVQSA